MRLIDAKEMEKQIKEAFKENPFLVGMLLRWVRKQPTIDAVPVVRCKDCKHRGEHEVCPLHDIRLCFDGDGHIDEVEDDKTEDEFFCSYGERKDGEG